MRMEHTERTSQIQVIEVNTEDLRLEPHAQREVDQKRAAKMADNWDVRLVGLIKVAVDTVTGKYYIVDGGHRWTSARLLGIPRMLAEVHYGLDTKERADLFLQLQQERKGIDKLTMFNVALTAERRRETEIAVVLEAHGLRVGTSPTTNVVAAVTTMGKVWDMGGTALVGGTIGLLRSTFAGFGGDCWQADIVYGTAIVLHRNPEIDTKRLVTVLQKYDPRSWLALVAVESKGSGGSGGRPLHMAKLVERNYNAGLRATSRKRIAI
jgi:hypothetical protein